MTRFYPLLPLMFFFEDLGYISFMVFENDIPMLLHLFKYFLEPPNELVVLPLAFLCALHPAFPDVTRRHSGGRFLQCRWHESLRAK